MKAKQIFWLQRLTAVAMIPPIKLLFFWLFLVWDYTEAGLNAMLDSTVAQVSMTVFLVAMVVHAGQGLQAIITDYVTVRMYPNSGKFLAQLSMLSLLLLVVAYLFGGLLFIWG